MSHAILAPSASEEWRWCAGSVSMSAGIGDDDTDASREGTAIHWVAEERLISWQKPDASVMLAADIVGQTAPNGVVITEEMYDTASVYVDDILAIAGQRGLLSKLKIEERVTMPEIHEHCWGTPDCFAFDEPNLTLYLWDLKAGHYPVFAFENWQLICYVLGVLRTITNNKPLGEHGITVVMRILQPRCYDGNGPLREWTVKAETLRGYVNQLSVAALNVFQPTVTCTTGKQCRNCEGARVCPALRNAVAGVCDTVAEAVPVDPDDATLVYELQAIFHAELLLKQRKEGLTVIADHRIRRGVSLPGFLMKQNVGRDKWLFPDDQVIAMGQLMGVNLLDEPKLLAPGAAKKQLKKNNVDASVISSYHGASHTSMSLILDDGEAARKAFQTTEYTA